MYFKPHNFGSEKKKGFKNIIFGDEREKGIRNQRCKVKNKRKMGFKRLILEMRKGILGV